MEHVFARPRASSKPQPWKKMDRPGLYRYEPAGTYYLRGRFGGEPVRLCLQTDDYAQACDKLEHERAKLRTKQKALGKGSADSITVAIEELAALLDADPSLREPTKDFYRWTLKRLRCGGEYMPPIGPLAHVTPKQMAEWWQRVAANYAPNQANAMLRMVRLAVKRIRRTLPYVADPTEDLKRVKRARTRLALLTPDEFRAVVNDLRNLRPGPGRESADYVEFMAYSGLRPKEIRYLEWSDVHQEFNSLEVWAGPDRPKNGQPRLVPIIAKMHELLTAMRAKGGGVGRLFQNRQPRHALNAACERCKVKRQKIYDLRHLFATTCLESGVPVPTFAGWMGHRDGGKLALSTYVHPRDEHRDQMAAKVNFG